MEFETITKYLDQIDSEDIGTWIIDRKNDGSPEHPIQMPLVNYSVVVHHFIEDVYNFIDNHKEMDLTRYVDILNNNGIEWDNKSMSEADVTVLDGKCVMALIVGAVRAERFCDGTLLRFFKEGSICKWLKRLKEIETASAQ